MSKATTIKLGHDGDEIRVNPSVEVDGSVTIHLTDSQEIRPCVGIASPAECDALIAAIGRALGRAPHGDAARIVNAIVADLSDRRGLKGEWQRIDDDIRAEIVAEWTRIVEDGVGRPVPTSTHLADAFDVLASERDAQGKACWNTDGDGYHGEATAYRHAAAMVREAGPTVPRGAVAAVRERLARVAAVLESDDRFAQREARQVLWKVLDDMKAMLDTSAATTTAKESCHADD